MGSPSVKVWVSKCLNKDPAQRPTAAELAPLIQAVLSKTSVAKKIQIGAALLECQQQNIFQKKIQSFLATMMSKQDDLKELSRFFREIDKDDDGMLSLEELLGGLDQSPNTLSMTKDSAEQLFHKLDDNDNGLIEYSEFVSASMTKDLLYSEGTL